MSFCFELEQESENALALKLKEEVIEKLFTSKNTENFKENLLQILSENVDQDELNKINLNFDNVSLTLDNYLANVAVCALDSDTENLNTTKVTVGQILNSVIDLICDPPSFQIPYPWPILDLSKEFLKMLLLALLRLVIRILLSILKKLLDLIAEICTSGLSVFNNFNLQNISNIIGGSIGEEVGKSFIADVFKAFGLNTDGTTAIAEQEDDPCADQVFIGEAIKNTSDFLNDLSAMTTPVELCSLFNGKATDNTFKVVEELINFDYPHFKKIFNNRNKIESLFLTLGNKVDPAICDAIESQAEVINSRPEICFTEDGMNLRKGLLKEKNFTDEQIKELIDKERQNHLKNLSKVAELAAKVRENPDKLLGEPPNIFCKGDEPGLISMSDMPSLQDNLSELMDTFFNNLAESYRLACNDYNSNLLSITKTLVLENPIIPKFIDVDTEDAEGNEIEIEDAINPEFSYRVTTGDYEICTKYGYTTPEALRSYYKDLETTSGITAYDDDGKLKSFKPFIDLTSVDEIEDGPTNMYILNYKKEKKIFEDITDYIIPNFDNLCKINASNLSISLKLPTKYVSPLVKNAKPNFDLVESNDEIIVYTVSKEENG